MKKNKNKIKIKQMEWKWNNKKTKGKENERLLVMKTRKQQTKKIRTTEIKLLAHPIFKENRQI